MKLKSVEALSNKEVAKLLKMGGKLLELHGENPFKIRSYENAAFQIERLNKSLFDISEDDLEKIKGIGKNIAKKIKQILEKGTYDELESLSSQTPSSLLELINLKGIGAKKLRILWKELKISSVEELLHACNNNRLENLKGFGKKTQDNIVSSLTYAINNRGKFLLSKVLDEAESIIIQLSSNDKISKIELTGALRRKCPVLQNIEMIAETEDPVSIFDFINVNYINAKNTGDEIHFNSLQNKFPVVLYLSNEKEFNKKLFLTSGNENHIQKINKNSFNKAENEYDIYKNEGIPYIIPEMRDNGNEFEIMQHLIEKEIIDLNDLKGILHTHTNYSDGQNSVSELSDFVRENSYEYLGISDHSQTAVYAGGLNPERVYQQIKEIDAYNNLHSDFKIFKGIESDILRDGSLDYEDQLLKEFDFIIASIHSGFNMTKAEATRRLINAIENPYTTILGHMTGRLLLVRDGYPVDHAMIIDACAANKVSIELNANPHRLDIDWKWLRKAIDKNVFISINPDAHDISHISFIKYGVFMARKAGIPKNFILNTLTLQEITEFFNKS